MAFFHGSVTICSAIKPTRFFKHQVPENEERSRDSKTHRTTEKEALTVSFKWDASWCQSLLQQSNKIQPEHGRGRVGGK